MAPIDDKVVAMSFESSKFESGVNKTLSALDRLKAALHFPSGGKGLDDLNAASRRVDLSHISRGVEDIRAKLGFLSVAALAVFAQIAQKAVATGVSLVKSFTIDPAKAGFAEYSTNLNAIQTILANTQAAGTNLKQVNAALKELNEFSDKTIYNFSQMAKNIGTFTAAGVDLKTSTASIKGIANLAALSGSNADQASTAMYQLSQAISAGSVKLQDWNSVVNAGMGGTVFQRALAQTAEAMGTIKKGAVELKGPMKNVSISGESFRQSLSTPGKASWLTSGVLTTTLKQFTGDLKDSELAAMGFNAAQIKAIQATAKTAMFAATEVKTLSQVLDVAKETAGSGWAQTWQIIFGDFGEAKKTFTALSNAVNGFINKNAEARNKVLADWKALGGRTVMISAITTAFHNLGLIIKPIKDAFRDIFPATSGKNLFDLTMRFEEFARALKPSAETVANLHRTFAGLFAVLDIGWQIIKGVFSVFGHLFHAVGGGSGGFLSLTATIGDFLVRLDEALKKGDRLANFFDGLGNVLAIPVKAFKAIITALGNLFKGFDGFSLGGFPGQMDGVSHDLIPFRKILDGIVEGIQNLGTNLGHAAAGMNFEAILQVIRTGLFAGLVIMFKQFLGKGSFLQQISQGFGKGIIGNFSSMFGSVTGSFKTFQNTLRAKMLRDIAIAIGILAASLFVLSLIDPKKLNTALGAITVLFAELIGAMALLDKAVKSPGFLKLPFIAGSLILLSVAIGLLTLSILALSRLSWDDLLKGLAGVGGLLAGVSAASIVLSANAGGMIRAGIGISAIAVAMILLATAVKMMGSMNMVDLAKGLGGVAVGLGAIVFAMTKMPVVPLRTTLGIIALSAALVIMASAIKILGGMNLRDLAKGLGGIGVALGLMVLAMSKMPEKSMFRNAAALVLMASALLLISKAVEKMGAMSIEELAKGLISLGIAMAILALGLKAMSGSILGAAALGVAATGLALLIPALVLLGKQSVGTIVKSLAALAGVFVILGVAGALIEGVVPGLLGFGAAMLLIGGGLALAGAGVFLVGAGLSAIAVAGPMAIGILLTALTDLTKAFGEMGKNLVLGLLEIVQAFAKTAPQFVDAVVKIIASLLDAVIKSTPKIAEAFSTLLLAALKILADNQDKIIKAGFDLILALLQGIRNNIPAIVAQIVDIIATFLRTIASNLSKIITAGASLVISFLKGIGDNLAKIVTAAIGIVIKFQTAILGGLAGIPAAGLAMLTKLLSGIANNIGNVVKTVGSIITKFITAVGNEANRIVKAGADAMIKFINGLGTQSVRMANAAGQAIVDFLRGLRVAIDTYAPQIRTESLRLGYAIIDGMTGGLLSKATGLYNTAKGIAGKALGMITGIFKPGSPSKVTHELGQNIILGLANGLAEYAPKAYTAAKAMSNGVINAFKTVFQITSPSKVMMEIGKFVGQGFSEGIRGSQEDINSAFAELNEKLTTAMATARETIASEQDKLDKLRASKKPDAAAIKEAQKAIAENQELLARSTAGNIILTKSLKDEKATLIGLAGDFEKVADKLSKAQDVLKQAIQTREEALRGFQSQFSEGPSLSDTLTKEISDARTNIAKEQDAFNETVGKGATPEAIAAAQLALDNARTTLATLIEGKTLDASGNSIDQLATYMQALTNQTKAVGTYAATLQQLRKLGLDDATYQKLLKEGTADQSFASQLLAGGKTAVKSLNTLDKNLMTVSKTLATNAADNLYQAGVDAAAGLVKGLKSKHDAIRQEMEEIAREMLTALRKELRSKSPSEAFAEIGRDSMAGLAQGFSNASGMVVNAVKSSATDALSAMKQSMRNISSLVTDELSLNPVITPILDLTDVQNGSKTLAALTNLIPINAATSLAQASLISSAQAAALDDESETMSSGTSVKFEQNNYSPESLSEIEIYRQTRNQLSQLKSVLALT